MKPMTIELFPVQCPKCDHVWHTRSTCDLITCSGCGRKISREQALRYYAVSHARGKTPKRGRGRLRRDQRGVSEALSAIMILVIIGAAAFGYYEITRGTTESQQAGLIDMLAASEHRSAQLLTLVYQAENRAAGTLKAYVYNYGTEDAELVRTFIDNAATQPRHIRDGLSGDAITDSIVEPKQLVEMTFDLPQGEVNYLTLETRWGAWYVWRLGT